MTPQTDGMNSTTTEQYALIATLLLIYAVQKTYQVTTQAQPIIIVTDSQETVHRANTPHIPTNIKETLVLTFGD